MAELPSMFFLPVGVRRGNVRHEVFENSHAPGRVA